MNTNRSPCAMPTPAFTALPLPWFHGRRISLAPGHPRKWRLDELGAVVAAAVVDDDDLDVTALAEFQPEQRKRARQVRGVVVRRNDQTDERSLHVGPFR